MAAIKSASEIAQKWARVTPQRTSEYSQGIQNPRRSWEASTRAAAENYKAGIQKSLSEDRFTKGVQKAGDQKWLERSAALGPSRFAEGVAVAEPQFQDGFAPYVQVIESTNLPPRFPKGDPRNLDRVKVMAEALRKKKLSL